jgi:hypothetical protein
VHGKLALLAVALGMFLALFAGTASATAASVGHVSGNHASGTGVVKTAGLAIPAQGYGPCHGGCTALTRGSILDAGDYIYGYTTSILNQPDILIMQTDGNLVLYNSAYQPCWASSTFNTHPGYTNYAYYQSDGNFVVYSSWNGQPLWASHTQGTGGNNVNINVYGQIWVGYTQINPACVYG